MACRRRWGRFVAFGLALGLQTADAGSNRDPIAEETALWSANTERKNNATEVTCACQGASEFRQGRSCCEGTPRAARGTGAVADVCCVRAGGSRAAPRAFCVAKKSLPCHRPRRKDAKTQSVGCFFLLLRSCQWEPSLLCNFSLSDAVWNSLSNAVLHSVTLLQQQVFKSVCTTQPPFLSQPPPNSLSQPPPPHPPPQSAGRH
jgi:hypothetical protein